MCVMAITAHAQRAPLRPVARLCEPIGCSCVTRSLRIVQQFALRLGAGAACCAQQSWPAERAAGWQVAYGSSSVAIMTIATHARPNMPCAMFAA